MQYFPVHYGQNILRKCEKYNLEDVEKQCHRYDGFERKMLTASLYREFSITGNRTHYEGIYFSRREELVIKTVLTCFYNDDRYMDDIIDLLWLMLEETTWTLPAHNHLDEKSDSLPNHEAPFFSICF